MKPIAWLGNSRELLSDFPDAARKSAGFELWEIQQGNEPADWKPMPSLGLGATELRVRDADGAFRVMYVARFPEAVYVLHAFQKKTRKTSKQDLDLGRRRYKDLIQERRNR